MKTHFNHVLRGGLKDKPTKRKESKTLLTSIPKTQDDEQQVALEEAARIYRESVMHRTADSTE
jgi:hypothetical protein